MFTTRNKRLLFVEDPAEEPGGGGKGASDPAPDGDPKGDGPDDTDEPDEDPDDGAFDAERALKKIHKANAEAARLRERARKAETDRDEKVSALEAEKLRLRIGYRLGLPEKLIDRLKGKTEEEILADAEDMLGALGAGKRPSPTQKPKEALRGGSKPDDEPEETDPRKLAARVPRR